MSVRPVSEIMAEMLSRYRKRPSLQDKWRFLAGLDERGYSDFFVYGPSFGIWQIKGELKNPYELVGAGAKVAPRRIDEDIREALGKGAPMPFGFLSPHPQLGDRAIVAAGVGRYQESTEELKSALPSRHHSAERELRRKLDEIRRKHGIDSAYG